MNPLKTLASGAFLTLLFSVSVPVQASDKFATVTQIEGGVRWLHSPSAAVPASEGGDPVMKDGGKFYRYRAPTIGTRVAPGEYLQTGPGARVQLVFDHGDVVTVGPDTKYGLEKSGTPTVDLKWGNVRAMISKKGPMNRLRVKTKSATMGVRGTDFYVIDRGSEGSEFSVLRGKVEVQPKAPEAKAATVEPGQTAEVKAPPAPAPARPDGEAVTTADRAPAAQPVIRETSKVELAKIRHDSTVRAPAKVEVKAEIREKIEKLEEKAAVAVLEDIKAADPKLYEQVKQKEVKDLSLIGSQVVEKLVPLAPAKPTTSKPYLEEFERSGDVYQKYFD